MKPVALFELFFNRVMFPIRDRRGRTISFGGRILGDGQPKYVNGPETALFSKRRTLYGLDLAREACGTAGPLVVVEGYMDVIATAPGRLRRCGRAARHRADRRNSWTNSGAFRPAPVLCFDGDARGRAGGGAGGGTGAAAADAGALAEVRHPARRRGPGQPGAQRRRRSVPGACWSGARPLSDALYDMLRERDRRGDAGAARGLADAAEEAAERIADKSLGRRISASVLLDRFFASRRRDRDRRGSAASGRAPVSGHRRRHRAAFAARQHRPDCTAGERARILTAILLRHPFLLHDVNTLMPA